MKERKAKKVLKKLCCLGGKHYKLSTIYDALHTVCKYSPRWQQPLGKHRCWCSYMKQTWKELLVVNRRQIT